MESQYFYRNIFKQNFGVGIGVWPESCPDKPPFNRGLILFLQQACLFYNGVSPPITHHFYKLSSRKSDQKRFPLLRSIKYRDQVPSVLYYVTLAWQATKHSTFHWFRAFDRVLFTDKIRFLKKPSIPTHKRQQMRSNAGKNVGKICGFGGEITEGSGT